MAGDLLLLLAIAGSCLRQYPGFYKREIFTDWVQNA